MKKNRALCLGLVILFGLLLPGCSALFPEPTPTATLAPTNTPAPPTATPLPLTQNPYCGDIVTLEYQGSELWFGQTGLTFNLHDFYFGGMVIGEHGLAEVNSGEVSRVTIQDREVDLTSTSFSGGSIHTEQFGALKILTSASIMQICPLLVVTPEQLTMIYAWLP